MTYDFRFWNNVVFKVSDKDIIYDIPKKDIAIFVRWLPNMIAYHPKAFNELNKMLSSYEKTITPHDIVWGVNRYLTRHNINYIKYMKKGK